MSLHWSYVAGLSNHEMENSAMAWLEHRNGKYRIVFRLNGGRYCRSLETKDQGEANLALAQISDGLRRIKLGTLSLSAEDDVITSLLSSGERRSKAELPKRMLFASLLKRYRESFPSTAIEETTSATIDIHIAHLSRIFGRQKNANTVTLADIQNYVNTRGNEPGLYKRNVSSVTIGKELATLYSAWRWAKESNLLDAELPRKKAIRFPKIEEKMPFKTYCEIERIISISGSNSQKEKALWDCLYLTDTEVNDLIHYAEQCQAPDCFYPMIACAAYTGARRSELLRSKLEDLNLDSNILLIREKKRSRGVRTHRTVPICEKLRRALSTWRNRHPGGEFLFTIDSTELSPSQAHDYFTRSLSTSKWKKLKGWHVLRHSFISNCASKGVDQRMIDDWVGHQTEAMRKRYRHLLPNQQSDAIKSVFD